jgi:hypothetical protein
VVEEVNHDKGLRRRTVIEVPEDTLSILGRDTTIKPFAGRGTHLSDPRTQHGGDIAPGLAKR